MVWVRPVIGHQHQVGAMVGGDGEPRGRRKFIRKPKRRHAAELADDAIRVGIFGASPVINKDMALLHPGQGLSYERSLGDDQLPQKLLEVVCLRGGDKKKSQRDGGPSGGKIRSGPMRNPRLVDEVRKNWRAHEVYSPYLQVTGEFGLGLRFKKF